MAMPSKIELYDQLACEQVYFRNDTLVAPPVPPPSLPPSGPESPSNTSLLSLSSPSHPLSSAAVRRTLGSASSTSISHLLPPTFHRPEVPLQYIADAQPSNGTSENTPSADPSEGPKLPNGPSDDLLCHSAPVLGASAALQMRLQVTTGVLSVLTTAYYAGLSDRLGRTWILRVAVVGLIVQDLVFLVIAHVPRERLPFGNNFLLTGAVFEGTVGGYPTLIAAHQAYVADSTPAGTRAQVFALFMALLFGGMALGPTLGSWLVQQSQSLMSVFYVATAAHVLYFLVVLFFLPESTSAAARRKAQREHRAALRARERAWDATHKHSSRWTKFSALAWERVQEPIMPLKMLLPRRIEDDEDEEQYEAQQQQQQQQTRRQASATTPLLRRHSSSVAQSQEASASHISVSHISKRKRWDMNLFLLSLGNFTETLVVGILSAKMLYGQRMFNWGVRELGIYMTLGSLSRVFALSLILPLAIKLLHRPKKRLNLPQDANASGRAVLDEEGRPRTPTTPHNDRFRFSAAYGATDSANGASKRDATSSPSLMSEDEYDPADEERHLLAHDLMAESWTDQEQLVEEMWTLRAKHLRMIHDSKFDLRLARVSIFFMLAFYAMLPFALDSVSYILVSCLTSLGSGGGAAMSSLALALLQNPRDAGKLFGAWSVMGAIGQTVLGPFIFTFVFQRTADTAPYSIFILACGFFAMALLFLLLVRVRKTRSLPPLPPRPISWQGSAINLRTEAGDEQLLSSPRSSLGPQSSTRSQMRLQRPKASQVFSDSQKGLSASPTQV